MFAEGAIVVDTRTGRLGRVHGQAGPFLRLRPLTGQDRVEWHCPFDSVRAAMDWERRNADVLDANWRFWLLRATSRPGQPGTCRQDGDSPPSGNAA